MLYRVFGLPLRLLVETAASQAGGLQTSTVNYSAQDLSGSGSGSASGGLETPTVTYLALNIAGAASGGAPVSLQTPQIIYTSQDISGAPGAGPQGGTLQVPGIVFQAQDIAGAGSGQAQGTLQTPQIVYITQDLLGSLVTDATYAPVFEQVLHIPSFLGPNKEYVDLKEIIRHSGRVLTLEIRDKRVILKIEKEL